MVAKLKLKGIYKTNSKLHNSCCCGHILGPIKAYSTSSERPKAALHAGGLRFAKAAKARELWPFPLAFVLLVGPLLVATALAQISTI